MFGPSNMPDYGRHFEPLDPWAAKLKLNFAMDDIVPVFAKVMLRYNGKLVSMPYDGDIHIMYWNKVAFERAENKAKFKAKYNYDLKPPKTWKQWDDAAEFFNGWGWDGSQNKLFGAGASYKPSGSGYSYHWWRQRFFAYGGNYFDANMKPLINSPAGVRALEEMVKTIGFYPPGVMLFPDADKYLDAIEQSFPLLVPDPVIPAADEYQRKLSFEITEALAKRKSPKDALDTAAKEWDKVTERRGVDKQKAFWGEKLFEMKQLGIEYRPEWAAKAK